MKSILYGFPWPQDTSSSCRMIFGFREYNGWSGGMGWGWEASRRGMGLKLGGRRTEGLGRACAERRALQRAVPGAGLPPAELQGQRRWVGAQPQSMFLCQVHDLPPPDAARRQRREVRHGGHPEFGTAERCLQLHSPHTAGGNRGGGGGGGGGLTSQASSCPGWPPQPRPPALPPERPAHSALPRSPCAAGPRSRVQPPPAPLTAGRWARRCRIRLSPGATHGTSRRAAGAASEGFRWHGEATRGACTLWGHAQAAATLDWHASWQGGARC